MPLSHSILIRHASRLGSAFRFGLGRGFGGPLGLGIVGGLVDRLRAVADCGGFFGVGKHDPCTFNLGPGSPDCISSYLGGLLGLVADSLKRGYRGTEPFLRLVQELDEAEKFGIREVAAVTSGCGLRRLEPRPRKRKSSRRRSREGGRAPQRRGLEYSHR